MRRHWIALGVLLCAAPAWAQMTDDDNKLVANYPLTIEKVEKALKASIALNRLLATESALARELDASTREGTLEDQIKRFQSKNKVVELTRSFDLTVRDFCLTTKAVATARMASRMPPKLPHPAASQEHIQFYRDHEEQIETLEADVLASYRERIAIQR